MKIQSTPSTLCTLAAAVAACGAFALASAPAHAGSSVRLPGKMNDTGLTRCTLDFGTFTTDCAGTGQDAAFGRDVSNDRNGNGVAGFAFQKVCNSGEAAGTGTCAREAVLGPGPDDWACTDDVTTGLQWEVKTADGGLRDSANRYTNIGDGTSSDASGYLAAVNAQGLCGAADWRLPTAIELQGIVDFNRAKPDSSIDPKFFPNSPADHWWTSDPWFGQEQKVAWIVSTLMDSANIDVVGSTRGTPLDVRLVRTPQAQAQARVRGPRFVASAAGGEVADQVTKLVWRRCVEGMDWDGTTCSGAPHHFSFPTALAHANDIAARTGVAWRVPNAKELRSIALTTTANPAIDTTVFPNTPSFRTWTSTAYAWTASGAWLVSFAEGDVLAYVDSTRVALRLVRDAE